MPSAGAIGLQLFNKYFVKNEKDRRKKMLKKGHFILLFLFSFCSIVSLFIRGRTILVWGAHSVRSATPRTRLLLACFCFE